MKPIVTLVLLLVNLVASAQFYTGYYVSAPQVHSFDHFKIKHVHDHTKLDGDLIIHAYIGRKEVWEQKAHFVSNESEKEDLLAKYGGNEDIISTHILKFMWDGNEWEYILLGYIAEDKHRHFIVIEEIFNDDTETNLLEFNRFDWVKGHHIVSASSN